MMKPGALEQRVSVGDRVWDSVDGREGTVSRVEDMWMWIRWSSCPAVLEQVSIGEVYWGRVLVLPRAGA